MKKYLCWFAAFLFTSTLMFASADRKRVAILNFDFGTIQNWWEGNWDIGKGISDLLVTQLVKDGTYSVVERKALDAILAEQNFSNSERADPNSAARIGKILGVDAIIVGSITQFGTEDKSMKVGGVGGRWGGFGGGKVGQSKGKAHVMIDARLVDVNTAEILAVAEGKGESSRSGLMLGGLGGGRGGFGAGEVDMGASNFRDTILGEATHQAVQKVSQELIGSSSRIATRQLDIRGLVAHVDGGMVILNVGSGQGVKVGDRLRVLRVTSTVKDPATGKVLRELTSEVAQIQIAETDEGSSVASVVSGSGVQVGDVVRNQ
jgi:curli biogenesis system outer membrane secretion channel CsgG